MRSINEVVQSVQQMAMETGVGGFHKGKFYFSHKQENHHLRNRGTAVVIRNGKVLLVRDSGKHNFSLPGGGVKHSEHSVSAASRELFEELGLHTVNMERRRDCDFSGSASRHKVSVIEARGEPRIQNHELDKFIWWNMKDSIPVYAHVTFILKKLGAM